MITPSVPYVRRASIRTNPGSSGSMPNFWIARTPLGVSPSPQTFSRGKVALSISMTSMPWLARWWAVAEPPGPAPTTRTSVSIVVVVGLPSVTEGGQTL